MTRVTPYPTVEDLEDAIVSEIYVTGSEAAHGAGYTAATTPAAVSHVTICMLTFDNGFVSTGVSHCANPALYSAETGRSAARSQAIQEAFPSFVFLAREALHQQQLDAEAIKAVREIMRKEAALDFA